MFSMCRPIFGSEKAVVFESRFCVSKGITEIEAKVFYVEALTKKWRYWPKLVPSDLIDTHFEYKEVCDVGMIEERNEDNNLFKIFSMKDLDYVMKIMASWMKIYELEGKKTRRDFIESSGTKETKYSTYRQLFGFHFRYINKFDNHNNWIHTQIYLEMIWTTKFWSDRNFAWYLVVLEVNTALVSG